MCVCVVPFVLDVRLVHAPAGDRQEGHTGFLIHLPSAVLTLIFIARRIQQSFSLVDREVAFRVPTNQSFSTCWAFFFWDREEKSQFVWPRFELTSQRQKVSRLPIEPPGRRHDTNGGLLLKIIYLIFSMFWSFFSFYWNNGSSEVTM